MISKDSKERKDTPIFSGVLRYFPDALAEVAKLSKLGNDKHNPGQPLHWSKGKSTDHGDCIVRHQMEFDQLDPENGMHHATMVAWRALAQLQMVKEAQAAGVTYQVYIERLIAAEKGLMPPVKQLPEPLTDEQMADADAISRAERRRMETPGGLTPLTAEQLRAMGIGKPLED